MGNRPVLTRTRQPAGAASSVTRITVFNLALSDNKSLAKAKDVAL